jgi:FAD/FMN-containing dehydrogenase
VIADVTLKLTPAPRARRTLYVPANDVASGLKWAGDVLPFALVASAVVVCKGCSVPDVAGDVPCLLVYTAEGIPEDVEAEINEVRRALLAAGAPEPVERETPTGTDLWVGLLKSRLEQGLIVRAGVPPKDIAVYVQSHVDVLEAETFLADVPGGLVYAVATFDDAETARGWVEKLRQPALEMEGYGVVMSAPETLRGALDLWGYRPETLDLMRSLKARWDPAGILNPYTFTVSAI